MNRAQIDRELATAKRIAPLLTDAASLQALHNYIADLNGRKIIACSFVRH